jgi:Putative peptidoglycan binding domain
MKQNISWRKVIVATVIFVLFFGSLFVLRASAAPNVSKAQATEIQMILVHHRYSLKIDGVYGEQTEKAVRNWQKVNGLFVDGIPGPITMQSLRDSIDVTNLKPAKRLHPPDPTGLNGLIFAPGGLDNCAEMIFYMNQAGLPDRFGDSGHHSQWVKSDGIGWRESKCNNTEISPTGCCGGYHQNFISSHLSSQSQYRNRIINECQVHGMSDIVGDSGLSKQKQMCVTKIVYDISGLSPWGG